MKSNSKRKFGKETLKTSIIMKKNKKTPAQKC